MDKASSWCCCWTKRWKSSFSFPCRPLAPCTQIHGKQLCFHSKSVFYTQCFHRIVFLLLLFLSSNTMIWYNTIRYDMIWWSDLLRVKAFNLAFASLSCFSLTFSTEVASRVCNTQFAFKTMWLPDYSGGDTMAYLIKKMGWVCRVYIGCREDLCDKLQHLSYHFFESCSWWHRNVGNRPEGSGIKWLSVEQINKLINII